LAWGQGIKSILRSSDGSSKLVFFAIFSPRSVPKAYEDIDPSPTLCGALAWWLHADATRLA